MCAEEMYDCFEISDEDLQEMHRRLEETRDETFGEVSDDCMSSPKLCGLSHVPTSRGGKKAYGIDLGTAYSAIAMLGKNGVPEIIPDIWCGKDKVASAVFFAEDGTVIVGECAKDEGVEEPERLHQFFKRWIGYGMDPNCVHCIVDGKEYGPIEFFSIVLGRIINCAKENGEDVKDVVITCPAYFVPAQRAAIKKAGIAAGLNVMAVINEATAAVANYARECLDVLNKWEKTILVYDLGGGIFEVSLMKVTSNDADYCVDYLDTDGDVCLGGCDWDNELYQLLLTKYEEQYGGSGDDMPDDLKALIRGQVEDLKMKLTNKEKAKTKIPYDGEIVILEVTREEFENATAGYVDQTIDWLNSVLQKANMTDDDVDVVLMVGGSTRMPMIRRRLIERFGNKVAYNAPDMAVAKGAAIIADMRMRSGEWSMPSKGEIFHLTTAEDKLKEHLQLGKARLVYDPEMDKVRIRYDGEIPENPIIERIVDDVRRSLNDLYEIHMRIDRIRRNTKGAFYDSKRAEDMLSELDSLIRNQKKIDQLFSDIDGWNSIESKSK